MKNRKTKKGFTIVELVIVIAVIGILSAILIPTFVNLTSQAQEAAKKQQVADAYTAYILEATDNKYDELYTRTGDSPNYDYTAYNQKVTLTQKTQADIAMKLNNEWFTYNSEKGWESKGAAEPSGKALVCNHFTVASTVDLCKKEGSNYVLLVAKEAIATVANTALSTFNGVEVYTYTHNA